FCAKCGKRLGPRENPRLAKLVQEFRLKTPYPYFVLLIVLFLTWAAWPKESRADYSHLKWSFELDRKADVPEEHLFQQALSLIVENTGNVRPAILTKHQSPLLFLLSCPIPWMIELERLFLT